jgi:4-amino-4-deoxy-L-arabinose transferase-like glycosyltransferase
LIVRRERLRTNGGDAVYDRIALGAFAMILVARVAYAVQAVILTPVLRQPMADSRAYVDWARAIASGQWISQTPFYRAPLYPFFIAPFYAIHARPEAAIVVLQVFFGLGSAILTWWIARRLYGRAAGLVALALIGFYGPLAAQETKILGTSLGILLSLLALAKLLSARSTVAYATAGFLLGLGALARPNALFVAVGAVLVFARRGGIREVPWLRTPAALLVGLILAVAPATLHNLAAGDFVPISSNGGMTFYHGNNEENRHGLLEPSMRIGAYGNAVEQEEIDRRLASQEVGRPLRASESSAHWFAEGLRDLARHPAAWLRLWGEKMLRFAGVHDYADNYSYAVERAQVSVLRLFLIPFPLILILAAGGLVLRAPSGRDEALLLLFAALGLLTCLLFYVGSRYRSESVPALAILAGRGVVALRGVAARRRGVAAAVSVLLLAFALVPPGEPAASQDAIASAQWAAALERDRRPADAVRFYRWATMRYAPLDVAWARWADLAEAEGGPAAGIAILDRGVAAGADGRMLRTHRGVMLTRAGRVADAETDYRRALQFAPGDPAASLNLAILLVRRGADREAEVLLDLPSLRENPDAKRQRALLASRARNRPSEKTP